MLSIFFAHFVSHVFLFFPLILFQHFEYNGTNSNKNWIYYLYKNCYGDDKIVKMYQNLLKYQSLFAYYTNDLYDQYIKPFDSNQRLYKNGIDMIVYELQLRAFSLKGIHDWLVRNGPTEYQSQVKPHFADQFVDKNAQKNLFSNV